MGQKLMGHTGAACVDALTEMSPDESVLILLKHCRDMKQQETRLRLITLFLLLGCAALFIFMIFCGNLQQHENSGSSGQTSTSEHSATYSKQVAGCPTDNVPNESLRGLNDLRSVFEKNVTNKTYMKWQPVLGGNYIEKERAIEIRVTGIYFVYTSFALGCHDEPEGFRTFSLQLRRLPLGYSDIQNLTDVWDGVKCPEGFRTVSVGRLFDLLQGDQVKVWVREGYKLITSSSFGVFRV
ncbi:uncharacterized protein LOC103375017 [Stegastes partitus]|uniref:Uncharacterized protein LOC103375017 n=1 Tax=Stegastes partitus TaxID=144197 RepID=A0A9Y4NUM7_9TELE|nr:PREDICTED: uncharacterized protein LOC103375017 [Stegastes partitus]